MFPYAECYLLNKKAIYTKYTIHHDEVSGMFLFLSDDNDLDSPAFNTFDISQVFMFAQSKPE
jgi:hypothetical protein